MRHTVDAEIGAPLARFTTHFNFCGVVSNWCCVT